MFKHTKKFVLDSRRSFKTEFRRQMRFAIGAAVGFLIAFAWREAIYSSIEKLILQFNPLISTSLSKYYSAIFLTFLGVIILFLSAKILKEN